MTLLLDTSVLIDLLRGLKRRRELLASLVHSGHAFATSAVSVAELYAGMRPSEEFATANLLVDMFVPPLNGSTARRAGDLKAAWARKGRTLDLTDTLIAATAIELDLTLITDNRRDFPMPEVRLFDLPPA